MTTWFSVYYWKTELEREETSKILHGRIIIYRIVQARMDYSSTSCVCKYLYSAMC